MLDKERSLEPTGRKVIRGIKLQECIRMTCRGGGGLDVWRNVTIDLPVGRRYDDRTKHLTTN